MAKKRHGGLGRGLDALIPPARREDTDRKRESEEKNSSPPAGGAGSGQGKQTDSPDTDTNSSMRAAEGGLAAGTAAGEQVIPAQPTSDISGQGAIASGPLGTGVSGADSSIQPQPTSDISGRGAFASGSSAMGNSGAGMTLPSQSGTSEQGEIRMLRLSQVDPNRSQPRKKFEEDSLEELADSIRQFGVLQPILVKKNGSRYEIIAGERRWRASRKAGLREIPAIIREYSNQEAVELSLIENIQRENLNPIEEAKAFKRLLDEFGLRQEDLAARVSKSRTAITNAIRLLKLDERVQEMVVEEQISMGHARALIPVEISEEQYLLAQQVFDKKLSVRDVEKLVKKIGKNKPAGQNVKPTGTAKEKDPALDLAYKAIEERLKQSLGTKASIRHGGDGTGKLEIEFYSNEDLEKIVDLLTMM